MRFLHPISTKSCVIVFCALVFGLTAHSFEVRASTPHVNISLGATSEIEIQITHLDPSSSWSFLNAYGGAIGLGERVENLRGLRSGESVRVAKLASGEFRSDAPVDFLRYVVRTSSHLGYLPFVSGVTEDQALVLPADLLPQSLLNTELEIHFDLPTEWRVEASLTAAVDRSYIVRNPEGTAFFAGRDLRVQKRSVKGIPLKVVVVGQWPFSDNTVMKSASDVLAQYYSMTGYRLRESPVIFIARLPLSNSSWKAETRGSTVTLLCNRGNNFKNWKGQLGIIFTHEVFHLWVPNSLHLKGEYDWFFEGFTMYVALQQALRLRLIDFEEYLNTLGRVYGSYLASPDDQTLLQASASRWTTSNSLVYDKGMLVAFIYDLTLRSKTQNQSTLAAIYPLLFSSANEPANANDVIIKLLSSSPSTLSFGRTYIESTERIDLGKILPAFGFRVATDSRINVLEDLTDEQKTLLHRLGYRK